MSTRSGGIIVVVLGIVIIVLAWLLWTLPVSAPTVGQVATSTATSPSQRPGTSATSTDSTGSPHAAPLHAQVTVTSPVSGSTVSHSLTVAGTAPGPWFFEAQFPIQIRDTDGNLVGKGIGQAQGDWMTAGLVTFTSTIPIDASFHGPATLILLRDNPSGLPENSDEFQVSIIVQ